MADETLKPIAAVEVDAFNATYPDAQVNIRYVSEGEAINALLKDSVKMIFMGRALDSSEINYLKEMQTTPIITHVATDGIAILVNKDNKDTLFDYDEVLKVLKGEIKNWQDLKGSSLSGAINIVFDKQGSGTVGYFTRLVGKKELPANAFAAQSNTAAVEYIAENPNAFGIIGCCWIADTDDPKAKAILAKTRVIQVQARPDSTNDKTYYAPDAYNFANGKYPFLRQVYTIVRERKSTLASGFSRFIHSDIGQRVLLKAGLDPANEPERIIELK